MEEHVDESAQRWEEKRRKQDAKLKERRREAEMRHVEQMQSMFMSVLQQMMIDGGWTPAPYPMPPVAGTFPPWPSTTTEESDSDSSKHSHYMQHQIPSAIVSNAQCIQRHMHM